jgi:hypothetical protein
MASPSSTPAAIAGPSAAARWALFRYLIAFSRRRLNGWRFLNLLIDWSDVNFRRLTTEAEYSRTTRINDDDFYFFSI